MLALAWFACAALTSSAPAHAELLVNPGAESGSLAGWSDALGNGFDIWISGTPPVFAGAFCFWGGTNGAAGPRTNELRQDVNVSSYASGIDTGTMLSSFSGRARSSANAAARVVVEFRNAASTVLATYDSGPVAPPGSWLVVLDSRSVPVGTRSVRVRLIGTRTAGSSTDAYFDALSYVVESPVGAPHATWGRIQRLYR
jgi:hypothetical protein